MKRPVGICVVSNDQCTAPAGWGTASGYATNNTHRVSTICSSCEEFVCRSCSTSVERDQRICDNCQEDM